MLCKYGYCQDWLETKDADSSVELQNLLETRYLFEPSAVFLSAKKIDNKNIKELEECLIRLSQAIIGMEIENLSDIDSDFRRIIYCSSRNRFLIFTMNQLSMHNLQIFRIFDQLSEFEKDSVFADYVEILNGLKKRDASYAKKTVENNILRMCEFLAKHTGLKMPELISEAIKINENNTEQVITPG